jgi:phospholipid/cholesterol/gamma-HCH transport system substrate-binding protein
VYNPASGFLPGPTFNHFDWSANVSRSLTWKQAAILGLVILLAGAGGVSGLFLIGDRRGQWGESFTVLVGFPRVQGVEVGTRVRVLGVDAGEVVAVEPPAAPGDAVLLRLRISRRLAQLIRSDASVEIASEGMIGGKVLEIQPGSKDAAVVESGALLAARQTPELNDVLGQVQSTLVAVKEGTGTLSKLINDPEAYNGLVSAVKQGEQALTSVQQSVDAFKRMPVVRSYVEDPVALLVRPNAERNRQIFAPDELFEPGRAVLTEQGQQRLNALAPWLEGLKHKGSDIVVASFADGKRHDAQVARVLTRQQSQSVCDYLTNQLKAQRMSWLSSRKVTPLGLGGDFASLEQEAGLPADRIEILVFVPQGL